MTAREKAAQRWTPCTDCRAGLIPHPDGDPLQVRYCGCPAGRRQAALTDWLDEHVGTVPGPLTLGGEG